MKSQKIHNFSRTKDIATVEHALKAIEMKEFITVVLCLRSCTIQAEGRARCPSHKNLMNLWGGRPARILGSGAPAYLDLVQDVSCVTVVALVNTDAVPSIANPYQIAANSYTSQ